MCFLVVNVLFALRDVSPLVPHQKLTEKKKNVMIIAQCCIIKPAVSVWRGERGEGEGTHHADLRPLKGRTGLFMRIMSPSSHPIQRTMGSLQLKWLKSRPSGSRE